MTQAAPKVSQMNQNLLLVKLMPITFTDTVHKLSSVEKPLFLMFALIDNRSVTCIDNRDKCRM